MVFIDSLTSRTIFEQIDVYRGYACFSVAVFFSRVNLKIVRLLWLLTLLARQNGRYRFLIGRISVQQQLLHHDVKFQGFEKIVGKLIELQ